jgi:hypothetical protein
MFNWFKKEEWIGTIERKTSKITLTLGLLTIDRGDRISNHSLLNVIKDYIYSHQNIDGMVYATSMFPELSPTLIHWETGKTLSRSEVLAGAILTCIYRHDMNKEEQQQLLEVIQKHCDELLTYAPSVTKITFEVQESLYVNKEG